MQFRRCTIGCRQTEIDLAIRGFIGSPGDLHRCRGQIHGGYIADGRRCAVGHLYLPDYLIGRHAFDSLAIVSLDHEIIGPRQQSGDGQCGLFSGILKGGINAGRSTIIDFIPGQIGIGDRVPGKFDLLGHRKAPNAP